MAGPGSPGLGRSLGTLLGERFTLHTAYFTGILQAYFTGMGEGPKRILESVDYRLESRPLTDPCPQSLGLDLDSTRNRTRLNHFK